MLAAQERLALKRKILAISQSTLGIVGQLGRVGQADETEILEAEAEEQRMEIAVGIAEQMLRRRILDDAGLPYLFIEIDSAWRLPWDRHPNARAARAIANAIAAQLRAQNSAVDLISAATATSARKRGTKSSNW